MIHAEWDRGSFVLRFGERPLASYKNQLDLWHFQWSDAKKAFVSTADSPPLDKVLAYFERRGVPCSLSPTLAALRHRDQESREELIAAIRCGAEYKAASRTPESAQPYLVALRREVQRPLKLHQVKAALHLLYVGNGANFSTPGSGKTAVVLAVFQLLRTQGVVDALFVVGPLSCFEPWRREYRDTLGVEPSVAVFQGEGRTRRRAKYLVEREDVSDLNLISFQTLSNDVDYVERFMRLSGVPLMLVVDEAHYMKKVGGNWALSLARIATHATRRVVLTGTPFPHNYQDSYNLFDFLWPNAPPIPEDDKAAITRLCGNGRSNAAARILDDRIGPLFYRVRKRDLGLAPQRFLPPEVVNMAPLQHRIYEAIRGRILALAESESLRNIEAAAELKKARLIRLRQCAAWPALLRTGIPEWPDYREDLLDPHSDLAVAIRNYEALEEPGKLRRFRQLMTESRDASRRVVVWSTFVGTIDLLVHTCRELGIPTEAIYGAVPLIVREKIIASFNADVDGVQVIVANPAACAESISLHVQCQDAIYYDLSYNCAQFLQSQDRIHRVGGSETREARYRFLVSSDSIDSDVLWNVQQKADRMSRVIDRDYAIYSLDMEDVDSEWGDVDAHDRLVRGEI